MVSVFIEKENINTEVEASNGSEVLKKLKINPEEVLIVKDNVLITPDMRLEDKDKVKLLSVISGG